MNSGSRCAPLNDFTATQNLGSGLVCGITVRAGAVVDAFGLLFWNRIANAEVLDMQQDYTPQPLVSSQNSAMVTCPMPGANVSVRHGRPPQGT